MDWYVMVWKKYAEFYGRSRRTEYWMFQLFNVPAALLLLFLGYAGDETWESGLCPGCEGWGTSGESLHRILGMSPDIGMFFYVPYAIYALAVLIPSLALFMRRLHDSGKSGWWTLIILSLFVPFVNLIGMVIVLVFMCLGGDPGPNEYGPNPRFPEQAEGMFVGQGAFTTLGITGQPQPFKGGNNFCKNCGATLKDASEHCTACGARI